MRTKLAQQLIHQLKEKGWKIRCVESCTAGGLSAAIASVSGASEVFDRGWVTYSNEAKHEEVGVPFELIQTFGAVSEQVVIAMAEGAVKGCEENTVSISVSGIAGPRGGTPEKPVGTVWIAVKVPHLQFKTKCNLFSGTRTQIQSASIGRALSLVTNLIEMETN